ncbi:MAG TPA: hypothetical protein VF800_02130 [Telluria sp.]|jgi:hypothetical protein
MNILSIGLATATLSAALLASAPAAASFFTTWVTPDGGARADIEVIWVNGAWRTNGFRLYDLKCDGLAPKMSYTYFSYIVRTNTKGCGTSVWFGDRVNLASLRLCNGTSCITPGLWPLGATN